MPQLKPEQRVAAMTLIGVGMTEKNVADKLGVSRSCIARLKKAAKTRMMKPGQISPPRGQSGGLNTKKLGLLKLRKLKRIILKYPFKSARKIKADAPETFGNVSIRTIQRALKEDLHMPSMRPAKKPLLTERQIQKRLQFCRDHLNKSVEWWRDVMFSDESNFKTIRVTSRQTVRRPPGSNRFDSRYTRKTVKHPPGVMIWGCFSGKMGRGGLFFMPKNTTMNSDRYIECLTDHLLPFMRSHGTKRFLQDGAPCHTSKKSMAFLAEQPFEMIDWPGSSPDLNPIENLWNWIKDQLQEIHLTSVPHLKEELNRLWIERTPLDYLRKLSDSMPRRLQLVLDNKGHMTKY